MSWAGAANIQDGVTMDLSEMNSVEISDDQKVTGVGPGARWHDVYSKLDALGLSVVGGRVSDVGVAGLTLGGNYSIKFNIALSMSLEHRCSLIYGRR